MTANHAELCERLRDQAALDQKLWGDLHGNYGSIAGDAADLIEQLAARIQQQALEYVSLFDQCSEHLARIAELEKERDALKVDAERYRWLRDKANATHAWAPMVFHCSPHCGIEWTNALCGEKLDVNVDAALQASKEPRS